MRAWAVGGLLGMVLAAGLSGLALAETSDRDQPMNIESDALRYESQQQRSIFTGNVVVTKGTIVMRGARLVVTQGGDGVQSATMYADSGKRAFFRQKRDGVDEYTEGEAQTIEYNGQKDTVHLVGNAEMRRLVGSRMQDRVRGSTIVYNNVTEVYTVQSGGSGSSEAAAPGGRVRATLVPGGGEPSRGAADGAKAEPSSAPLRGSGKLAVPGSER